MTSPGAAAGRLALWLSLGACAAAAFWTADGVAPWNGDLRNVWHHYEYLAEGFLHGHTYLSVEPAPELLKLRDPYDPEANAPYRLWDASLYQGKYYLYYGPAPAVVLLLPWRVLTGRALPQRLAVAAFAAVGLAGLALLLREVRNRHFPRLSDAALGAIVIVAFHASWLPVILRRPGFWEMPIVSAVACLWWAVYFLWKFHDSGGRARWAAAGGAALALLMGCRVTFVFAAVATALLYLAPSAGPDPTGTRRRGAAPVASAVALAGGVGLLLYNYARFGSWLEFGQSYQLWGAEYRGFHFFSPRNILFNAQTYLFSLPQIGPYFPFLHPFWTEDRPEGYMGFEEIYGVLFMMPVHLAGIGACAWAWRSRADRGARAAAFTLASAVLATAFAALVLFSWGGACSRYTTELMAGWTVATSVGLMCVFGQEPGARPGRALRALAAAAACWSVASVWLASADFRGFMARTNRRTYAAAAHTLDYPSLWWARAKGVRFGPLSLVIRIPPAPAGARAVLVASGRPQNSNRLILERVDGEHARLVLAHNEFRVLETPELALRGGRLAVRLDAPWLYPPPAHPYWDGVDPAVALERETLFRIEWDSGGVLVHSVHSADPVALEPAVAGGPIPGSDSPYVESLSAAAPPHAPTAAPRG
ncbi:MAG TPA: hypothetical protein VN775_01605 [Opitutaceae bacterium]|nr:hypothetical protein [Opitutaceae bacterium]